MFTPNIIDRVAGYHSDSDHTLLPLPKSAITWFGSISARLKGPCIEFGVV